MYKHRTILIGDIHGCVDEFKELVHLVDYNKETDRLILLGDLIDRGPDSAGVVRLARDLNAECVIGNHEEKMLRWYRHEAKKIIDPRYKNPMRKVPAERLAQWEQISDDDKKWIASLPVFIRFNPGWVALHAGCLPNVAIEDQHSNDLIRVRFIDNDTGKHKPIGGPDDPPNTTFWADLWTGPEHIVYGHYTREDPYLRCNKSQDGIDAWTIGIDTGCYHGNKLTAYIVEDGAGKELVHVMAKKEYFPRKLEWDDRP